MNQFPTEKKITLLVFVTSTLGIASEFIPFAWFSESFLKSWGFIFHIGKAVSLDLLAGRFMNTYNSDLKMFTGYGNVVFHLTLLLGGIFWVISEYRESRLIRFSFCLVFINGCLRTFSAVMAAFVKSDPGSESHWILWSVFILIDVGWTFAAWWIITKIGQTKVLDSKPGPDGTDVVYFIPTPKRIRFFHLVADTIFCVLLFSNLAYYTGFGFIKEIASSAGDRTAVWIWFIIARVMYYFISEAVFSASPAKFLTETRAVNEAGTNVGWQRAGQRTLFRFVPFEPFSFMFPSGWHDRWSDTEVANEKRTGVPGGRYAWILIAYVGLGLGTYFGMSWYSEHKYYVKSKQLHEQRIASNEEHLKHLSNQDFIKLKDADKPYGDGVYLKVDKVTGDAVEVVELQLEEMWRIKPLQLERYFETNKEWMPRITIKRSDLQLCLTHDYDKFRRDEWDAMPLLHDDRKLTIERIERMYGPLLTTSGSGSSDKMAFNLEMNNIGWPGTLTEIKNIEGNVIWEVDMPMRLESSLDGNDNDFYLRGGRYSSDELYKTELTVVDTTGVRRKFMLIGKGLDREVYPVFE